MQQNDIIKLLSAAYGNKFDRIAFLRDGGSVTYEVGSSTKRYFLRAVKPAFLDTAIMAADVHVYLQQHNFPVVPLILTGEGSPYLRVQEEDGDHFFLLYEFIEGEEANPEVDAVKAGALIGRFHQLIQQYPGSLVKRDKCYFIDRYIELLKRKSYSRVDEFKEIGDQLWEKIKDLPRGLCHGDMYSGNIQKTADGSFFLLDFDTCAEGFQMFDIALFCNMTDYFEIAQDGFARSKSVLDHFLPEYSKYRKLTQLDISAFFDLIAVYHFQLQATIIELYGLDCVDESFLDKQLNWLRRWEVQCTQL